MAPTCWGRRRQPQEGGASGDGKGCNRHVPSEEQHEPPPEGACRVALEFGLAGRRCDPRSHAAVERAVTTHGKS